MHKGSCSIILPYEIAPKKFFGLVEKLLQTLPTFLTCLALSSVLDIRCSMGQNDRMTSKHIFSMVLTNSFYWILHVCLTFQRERWKIFAQKILCSCRGIRIKQAISQKICISDPLNCNIIFLRNKSLEQLVTGFEVQIINEEGIDVFCCQFCFSRKAFGNPVQQPSLVQSISIVLSS